MITTSLLFLDCRFGDGIEGGGRSNCIPPLALIQPPKVDRTYSINNPFAFFPYIQHDLFS